MAGREGTILVHGIRHGLRNPNERCEASAHMDGVMRMHDPVTIIKKIDLSTPKLLQALVSGEMIERVTLKWYRIDRYGHEEHYFTDVLENAIVKKHEIEMETESVSIAYEKITWRHEIPSIEAEDRWQVMTTSAGIPLFGGAWRRRETSSLTVKLVDDKTSKPVSGVKIRTMHDDGSFRDLVSDSRGNLIFSNIKKGFCEASSDISLYWGAYIGNTLAYIGTGETVIKADDSIQAPQENPNVSSLRPSKKPKYLAKIVEYKVREGDTLASIAESHNLTFRDLAFFNWGTYKKVEVLRWARRDTGCTHLTKNGKDLRFSDATEPGIVFIPSPIKLSELATDTPHTIRTFRGGYDRFYASFELHVADDDGVLQEGIQCELTNPDGTTEVRLTNREGAILLQGINAGKTKVKLVDYDSHDIAKGDV